MDVSDKENSIHLKTKLKKRFNSRFKLSFGLEHFSTDFNEGIVSDQFTGDYGFINDNSAAFVEVFDTFGILMTHAYGVPAGAESPVLSFPDGVTTFVISTSQSTKTIEIDMANCTIYQVTIDENNQLDTDVPTAL